jgi:hypothetical protein
MFVYSATWKPGNSIFTLYVPGSRFSAVYEPASSATVERRNEVPTFSTVMTQPGMIAPDWSRTVPKIVPNVDCPKAAPGISVVITQRINIARNMKEKNLMLAPPLDDVLGTHDSKC